MYDLLIKNVRIIDGSGSPWYRGDVAVSGERIAKIGKIDPSLAKEVVDGNDEYLTPGFIDIHCHSDITLPNYPLAESRILQGVTTEIGGNCGMSVAPVSDDPEYKKMLKDYIGDLPYNWKTIGEYLDTLENKVSVNFGTGVGQGSIRIAAMGFDNREPSDEEMALMKDLLRESLEGGAFCMSTGLIYPPGIYSGTDEIAELSKVLPEYNSFYETHMRNEGVKEIEALNEAMEIARKSGSPLQVSHHKCINRAGWEITVKTTTAMIEKARKEGLEIMVDQYPYIASATTLNSNLPNWAFEGGIEAMLKRLEDPVARAQAKKESAESHKGRWHTIYVAYAVNPDLQWAVGKNIMEIAEMRGVDPEDACFDIIYEDKGRAGEVNYGMCEEDVEYIMKKPYVMIGSDGQSIGLDYVGQPHPRYYGTFPRVIAHYCRDRKLFPIEEAIRKMTGLPATRLRLNHRGLIKEGNFADLVLFNFDEIKDTPDFEHPKQACEGIRRVYVNGVLTAKDGKHTGATSGRILRRGADDL